MPEWTNEAERVQKTKATPHSEETTTKDDTELFLLLLPGNQFTCCKFFFGILPHFLCGVDVPYETPPFFAPAPPSPSLSCPHIRLIICVLLNACPYHFNLLSCTFLDISHTFIVPLFLSLLILSSLVIPTNDHPSLYPHFCHIQLLLSCFLHCPRLGTVHHCWSYNRLVYFPLDPQAYSSVTQKLESLIPSSGKHGAIYLRKHLHF